MMQCVHTSHPSELHFRLGDLSDALICARKILNEARHFNHKQIEERAAGPLKVGDTDILRANERMTFTNYLGPQYEVFKISDIVYWVRHQPSGHVRILNRSKPLLVDPNVCWDNVHK